MQWDIFSVENYVSTKRFMIKDEFLDTIARKTKLSSKNNWTDTRVNKKEKIRII